MIPLLIAHSVLSNCKFQDSDAPMYLILFKHCTSYHFSQLLFSKLL